MPKKRQAKPTHVQLKDGTLVCIGTLVAYYRNGWHYGYITEIINESLVKIQPASPQGAKHLSVPVEDMKAEPR